MKIETKFDMHDVVRRFPKGRYAEVRALGTQYEIIGIYLPEAGVTMYELLRLSPGDGGMARFPENVLELIPNEEDD